MLGVIIEKKIEKRPGTRSGSDLGNEQNKSDNDETNPEASDETDHAYLVGRWNSRLELGKSLFWSNRSGLA